MAEPAAPRRAPLRILTAVPLCDGHDSAVSTINLELVRSGAEVIYLGYHQAASAIARAAIQEDVHAVGISSYNGGHVVFFREVRAQLRARGGADIRVFAGGGGTITPADARVMKRAGVDRIFYAGTPLSEIVAAIRHDYRRTLPRDAELRGDRGLARTITLGEAGTARRTARQPRRRPDVRSSSSAFTIGVTGPGGAGKSTRIDELTLRFLRARSRRRMAILANDPSHPDHGGALLGDRVSALYAQDDRVYFRSLATRGSLTGLSAATPAALEVLRRSGEFDLIFVESIGIGQVADPFHTFDPGAKRVDAVLFVASPHDRGQIQRQKIALLQGADLVVLNKCDDPRAATARAELTARLAANPGTQPLYTTIASRPHDPGVDALYAAISALAGLEPAGGERACQLQINE